MKFSLIQLCGLLCAALMCWKAHSGEGPAAPQALPDDAQMTQAQERGKKIRTHTGVAPEALLHYAAIFKVSGVRCGHESFSLDDAKGEGGAVYRCTERFKLLIPGQTTESVEYTHQLLLNADFSLLSGKQICTSVVNVNFKPRTETLTTGILVAGDTLELSRSEKIGELAENKLAMQPTRLLGVRPIPGKALLAMAALARSEPAPLSGGINPFMVSTIYMGWGQAFIIQSAWLSFEKGTGSNALNMSVRYLDGELSDKGLMVEAPTDENWKNAALWSFDEKMRVTKLPAASESYLTVEMVEADKLDADAPLDREKIAAAMLALTQGQSAPQH